MKSPFFRLSVCICLIALLSAAGLMAFSSARLRAKIPFEFYAADQVLPAGSYFITTMNNGRAYKIQRQDGPEFAIVMSLPGNVQNNPDNSIIFHRYGSDYFLRSILSNSASMRAAIWKSDREKELASSYAKSKTDKRLAGPVKVAIRLQGE